MSKIKAFVEEDGNNTGVILVRDFRETIRKIKERIIEGEEANGGSIWRDEVFDDIDKEVKELLE